MLNGSQMIIKCVWKGASRTIRPEVYQTDSALISTYCNPFFNSLITVYHIFLIFSILFIQYTPFLLSIPWFRSPFDNDSPDRCLTASKPLVLPRQRKRGGLLSTSFSLARRKGFEPPTFWFVAKHSIQLS